MAHKVWWLVRKNSPTQGLLWWGYRVMLVMLVNNVLYFLIEKLWKIKPFSRTFQNLYLSKLVRINKKNYK